MTEWRKVKLGDICSIKSGKRLPKGADFSSCPTENKYIRARDIKNGVINGEDLAFISNEVKERISKYIVNTNDVIVTIAGTIGEVAFVTSQYDGVNLTENAIRLTDFDHEVNSKYVFYTLRSNDYYEHMQKIAGGAAQPKMGIYKLEAISIALPSVDTQERIVDILSRYDTLIENYQRQIKLLEEAAQRLYKEWFVDLRFPGHQSTPIINNLPQSWQKKKLGEIFTFIRGKSYTSKELSDEGTLMVSLKNIQAFGGYKRDAEKRFTGDYKVDQSLYKGDLIMGVTDMTQERRLVGHVALVPDFNEPATFSMDLIKILPFELPNVFLYCAMRFGGISTIISPLANGVNVLHLKPDAMMNIEMTIPSNDLIMRFTSSATSCIEEINKLENQIRNLSEARDRLLPKLMSGEIEV